MIVTLQLGSGRGSKFGLPSGVGDIIGTSASEVAGRRQGDDG